MRGTNLFLDATSRPSPIHRYRAPAAVPRPHTCFPPFVFCVRIHISVPLPSWIFPHTNPLSLSKPVETPKLSFPHGIPSRLASCRGGWPLVVPGEKQSNVFSRTTRYPAGGQAGELSACLPACQASCGWAGRQNVRKLRKQTVE